MNRRTTFSLLASLLLAATAALALAAPASAKLTGFQTKNGNVGCYISGQGARCDVKDQQWMAPPAPASCELDYGFGVTVGRRSGGEYVCAGDTALDPSNEVLARGEKIKAGRFKCKNLGSNTIKCVNTRNKTGFEVSQKTVSLF